LVLAGSAHAASKDVHYGPAPSWVEPPPIPTDRETPADAPLRVVYLDNQTRVTRDAEETHSAFRIKVLKPEALAIGNLTGTWNPSTDDITINGLKIIRDGKTIDVLARTKFGVIEREDKLDYAVLDGALTASVQTPGLQVGDELEFALTISRHDTTFGGVRATSPNWPWPARLAPSAADYSGTRASRCGGARRRTSGRPPSRRKAASRNWSRSFATPRPRC
jgi:hypothetical protein